MQKANKLIDMYQNLFRTAAAVLLTVVLFSCGSRDLRFTEETGMVPYECQGPHAGKTVAVYYHIPAGDVRTMPVLFVMHGMGRNADEYRDNWNILSDQYGFILLAPEFTDEQFPEEAYQQGHVVDADGHFLPKEEMTYPIIREIFHFFQDHSLTRAKKYSIYGHSAGSQFVHRYLLFNDTPEVDRAVAANAGWYTFPTDTIGYPYGIGDSADAIGTDVKAYYGKRMLILLGDADTLRSAALRKTPEADAQGRNRFERGNHFFEYCREDAAARGVPFNWEIAYVPGSGHSDKKMSPEAARLLYGE